MVDNFGYKNQAQNYAKFRPAYPHIFTSGIFGSLKGPKRIALDIGCGTGFLAAQAASQGFQKVFGTDLSQKQIDEANKQYSEVSNLQFEVSKVEDLDTFINQNEI